MTLGRPHLHLATVGSTNDRARELALAGAPHGTTITASEQTAGRGRRGRTWVAPAGQALLLSVVLRDAPKPLTIRVAVAAARACGERAQIKWPNDILIDGRKVAGILCEQHPGEDWTIAGIGVNVAVDIDEFDPLLRESAGTLGRIPTEIPAFGAEFLAELEQTLTDPQDAISKAWSSRDALLGEAVEWQAGSGKAAGINANGHLLIDTPDAGRLALDSGEVNLVRRV